MEKIIMVLCGTSPTQSALNFACYLADLTRSRITGFIFEKEPHYQLPSSKKSEQTYFENITIGGLEEHREKAASIEHYLKIFERTCQNKGIAASAKYLDDNTLQTIITESAFTDLIIADAAINETPASQDLPSQRLQILLEGAKCPVIIAPASITPVNEIVFCYDGSPSAIFAMKQFCYLLP